MESQIAKQLDQLLADYAVYYQKLRNYHWNVRGKRFFQLHEEFEQLYGQAETWVDGLAERIAQLDERPTATVAGFAERTRLEEKNKPMMADEMVRDLIGDIGRLDGFAKDVIETADDERDYATTNMLEDVCQHQEENAWMLRSWLQEK